MPALNESGVIGATLESIPRDLVDAVWVADNGSTDGTVREARAHGADVVVEPRRGYGSACQAALRQMVGDDHVDVIVFVDADGSQPVDELEVLVQPIADDGADLVIGYRRFRDTPIHVAIGNRLACLLLRLLTGHAFHDLGPFRAARLDSIRRLRLRDPDYGWNVEMQARAVAMGFRIVQVPVSHRKRTAGRSKISGSLPGTLAAGAKILWTAVREGYRARRVSD